MQLQRQAVRIVEKGHAAPGVRIIADLLAADAPALQLHRRPLHIGHPEGQMAQALRRLPEEGRAAMVGYLLKNTASLHGTVTRGLCAGREGILESVRETRNIQLYPDGSLRDLGTGRDLDPDAVVSMNFWGFMPSIFSVLRRDFEDFLRAAGDDLRAERLLPEMVDEQLRRGALEVSLLSSAGQWFGMTYREDREAVAQALLRLHESGEYPRSLRD